MFFGTLNIIIIFLNLSCTTKFIGCVGFGRLEISKLWFCFFFLFLFQWPNGGIGLHTDTFLGLRFFQFCVLRNEHCRLMMKWKYTMNFLRRFKTIQLT